MSKNKPTIPKSSLKRLDMINNTKIYQSYQDSTKVMSNRVKELNKSITKLRSNKPEYYKNHFSSIKVPKTRRLIWNNVEKYKSALQPEKGKKRDWDVVRTHNKSMADQVKASEDTTVTGMGSGSNGSSGSRYKSCERRKEFKLKNALVLNSSVDRIANKPINRKRDLEKLDLDRTMQTSDIEGASPNKFSHHHKKYDISNYSNSKDNINGLLSMKSEDERYPRKRAQSFDKNSTIGILKNNAAQILNNYDKSTDAESAALGTNRVTSPAKALGGKSDLSSVSKPHSGNANPILKDTLALSTGYEDLSASKTPQMQLPGINRPIMKRTRGAGNPKNTGNSGNLGLETIQKDLSYCQETPHEKEDALVRRINNEKLKSIQRSVMGVNKPRLSQRNKSVVDTAASRNDKLYYIPSHENAGMNRYRRKNLIGNKQPPLSPPSLLTLPTYNSTNPNNPNNGLNSLKNPYLASQLLNSHLKAAQMDCFNPINNSFERRHTNV